MRLCAEMNVRVPQNSSLFVRTKYVREEGQTFANLGISNSPKHLVPKQIDQSYRTDGGGGNGDRWGYAVVMCMYMVVGTILTACCCHRSPLYIFLILFLLPLVVTNNPFKGVVS